MRSGNGKRIAVWTMLVGRRERLRGRMKRQLVFCTPPRALSLVVCLDDLVKLKSLRPPRSTL